MRGSRIYQPQLRTPIAICDVYCRWLSTLNELNSFKVKLIGRNPPQLLGLTQEATNKPKPIVVIHTRNLVGFKYRIPQTFRVSLGDLSIHVRAAERRTAPECPQNGRGDK